MLAQGKPKSLIHERCEDCKVHTFEARSRDWDLVLQDCTTSLLRWQKQTVLADSQAPINLLCAQTQINLLCAQTLALDHTVPWFQYPQNRLTSNLGLIFISAPVVLHCHMPIAKPLSGVVDIHQALDAHAASIGGIVGRRPGAETYPSPIDDIKHLQRAQWSWSVQHDNCQNTAAKVADTLLLLLEPSVRWRIGQLSKLLCKNAKSCNVTSHANDH